MENKNAEAIPRVKCPVCGAENVYATILTIVTFKKDCPIFINGIDLDYDSDETVGSIIGDFACDPILKQNSYKCYSCGEHWISGNYRLEKNENGEYYFEKGELDMPTRKRTKK